MGVSFKISKKGTRFQPKPLDFENNSEECGDDSEENSSSFVRDRELASTKNKRLEDDVIETGEDAAGVSGSSSCSGGHATSAENEISFTLNLYEDGYLIGKPTEASAQDIPKSLHPYDRTSATLFSAIEAGRLPGDILDDIPSKYVDGKLLCEVRDYRKSPSEPGGAVSSVNQSPVINRVSLRISLENVVKDMSLISDTTWTYSDFMEVEARIVKALQPQLLLDPTPMLDRLCSNPVTTKLNLGLCGSQKKRLRETPEVIITANNQTHGKKVCIDKLPESANCRSGDSGNISGDAIPQRIHDSVNTKHLLNNTLPLRGRSVGPEASTPPLSSLSKHHQGVGYPRVMQDQFTGSSMNASTLSPSGRDFTVSYSDPMNYGVSSLHVKRESQDAPLTPSSKRVRQTSTGLDGIQRHHLGQQLDNLADISWNNSGLQSHPDSRNQYGSMGGPKQAQNVLEGVPNQDANVPLFSLEHQGSKYAIKDEQLETEKSDRMEIDRGRNNSTLETENSQLDLQQSRLQQRVPQHPLMRTHFPQMQQWHSLGQPVVDTDPRKERKLVQSPRVSSVPVVQSPVSSKSGEFSSGSFGHHFNAGATNAAFGSSQKEKSGVISGITPGGPSSVTSSPSDSMQRQHQGPMGIKRRPNSLPRTPSTSMGSPMNANSPSVGTTPSADQIILDRFSKIDMVTQRYQLNVKKTKVDDDEVRKPLAHSAQVFAANLSSALSNAANSEDFKDPTCTTPMSKSLIGGSMNVCKTRALTFLQSERRLQGNVVSIVKTRHRLLMTEKPVDGTVVVHCGDGDDCDLLDIEDHLPTLPNTHRADLLAAQFFSLMAREGFELAGDEIRPRQNVAVASNPLALASNSMSADGQQYPESNLGQAFSGVPTSLNSGNPLMNASQGHQNNAWVQPSGSSQPVQMSQGFLPGVARPVTAQQQLDVQQLQQQTQQQSQHPLLQQQQAQRGPLLVSPNPLSHLSGVGQASNAQLANHMLNKPAHTPIQMLQHQQQQQQQLQQRKMMMGLAGNGMNMGNMGNNMVGLGGLGNVMGMGGARGMGGPGISASMGPISGIGNMGQNPMNASNVSNLINQQIRSGNLTHAQAAAMASRLRLGPNRGGIMGGPQSGISGIPGADQMHPGSTNLSMLGPTLNRSNINPLQRTNIASMGPPKLIPGTNFYMNQQQQQQQLQFQHQQQQLQQQQQHMQQQQQQISSPLQAVVSPQQASSPSAMSIPQQMTQQSPQQQFSPQQMNQQSPMSPRLSSGALPPLNPVNIGAGPASPQLSSQTLGSVGSITSSMDLQGVNKSNSASNVQG